MNNGLLAKIGGWGQFALQLLSSVTQTGLPHGVFGWLSFAGSLLAAVGIHAASNSGPAPSSNGSTNVIARGR